MHPASKVQVELPRFKTSAGDSDSYKLLKDREKSVI